MGQTLARPSDEREGFREIFNRATGHREDPSPLEAEAEVFFRRAFLALTKRDAFPWQVNAFAWLAKGRTPSSVGLPTGTGKTSMIPIWVAALAWQASKASLTLPRRLVWVVNRRVVVDQATDEAVGMIERLASPESGEDNERRQTLMELRRHLAGISFLGVADRAPVTVSTLRGQLADNGEWALDPSRPAIVIGTVDMIGSRLLFSGYGDGKSKRPLHAGLLGHDAWIVLDEAHLTPAFAELLRAVRDVQQGLPMLVPFCVSLLSATQRVEDEGESIAITSADEADPIIGKRLASSKCLRLHPLSEKGDEVDRLVNLALAYRQAKVRVIVYVKSPKTAAEVSKRLAKEAFECQVRVLTGTLRGFERDQLADDPVFEGFRSDPDRQPPEVTHYLVSTSAGEVGADLDADHLICDLSSLDSLIQRFGRVNRLGFGKANLDLVYAKEQNKKDKDEEDKDAKVIAYLMSLPQVEEGGYNVSPSALKNQPPPLDAFTDAPPIVPLAPHWLDMWSLTSIRDADWPERPEVAPWLHGVGAELPETWVVWREDVESLAQRCVKETDCTRVFDTYDIRPHEQLREPTGEIRTKLKKLAQERNNATLSAIVLRGDESLAWRGTLADLVTEEAEGLIKLNYATVVLPPTAGGLTKDGLFNPGEPQASDVADKAYSSRPRRRFLVHGEDGEWSAQPIAADGDDGTEYKGESLSGLISVITKNTGLKLVANVQMGGHEETMEETARHLLYFADPVSAVQSSVVSFVSREKQALSEHNHGVAAVAADIAARVGLGERAAALGLAGGNHDIGKNRHCWQLAIDNPDFTQPLAKSGHARFDQVFNGGYRHEFGSLLEACKIGELAQHPERDLILHIIASHHGNARPHFKENGFDKETALNACQAEALEAMQRFGCLQARYGWWGLAWLEALLKAADALVSGGFDQGGSNA